MQSGAGTGKNIKRYTHLRKTVANDFVVLVHNSLRSHALFHGANSYGHPMLVRTADKFYISFLSALITHIYVRWQVSARQVTYMHRPVGIRKGSCYQYSFVIFFHAAKVIFFTLAPKSFA